MRSDYASMRLHWYRKLRDDGFVDIEFDGRRIHPEHKALPREEDGGYARAGEFDEFVDAGAKERVRRMHEDASYYAALEQHCAEVRASWHETAWRLHCDGQSVRAIARQVPVSHVSVWRYIKREEARLFACRPITRGYRPQCQSLYVWREQAWRMHCSGITLADIAARLPVSREQVATYLFKRKRRERES